MNVDVLKSIFNFKPLKRIEESKSEVSNDKKEVKEIKIFISTNPLFIIELKEKI